MTRHSGRGAIVAVGLVIVLGGCSLQIDPSDGPPNTPYKVTVFCDARPTLYGRPLADAPPPTQVPVRTEQAGPSRWTYDAVSSRYDDEYVAICGSSSVRQRFDADSPRLHLGPVPSHSPPSLSITDVEGTDCPSGTRAEVTISVNGQARTYTASIDRYGDWAVDLPVPFGTQAMTVVATCGTVSYPKLTIPATTATTADR